MTKLHVLHNRSSDTNSLLDAAGRLFRKQGYASTTVRQIAEAAGIRYESAVNRPSVTAPMSCRYTRCNKTHVPGHLDRDRMWVLASLPQRAVAVLMIGEVRT